MGRRKGFKMSEKHKKKISLANSGNHLITAFNQIYGNYKYQAKKRNYDFKLTKEQFKQILKEDCRYCGRPPEQYQRYKTKEFIYNGIDRIDNNKGYVKENCASACVQCNRAKGKMSELEFVAWVEKIYDNYEWYKDDED